MLIHILTISGESYGNLGAFSSESAAKAAYVTYVRETRANMGYEPEETPNTYSAILRELGEEFSPSIDAVTLDAAIPPNNDDAGPFVGRD